MVSLSQAGIVHVNCSLFSGINAENSDPCILIELAQTVLLTPQPLAVVELQGLSPVEPSHDIGCVGAKCDATMWTG